MEITNFIFISNQFNTEIVSSSCYLLCYRVDKNEDGRITEEEVKEVVLI